MNKGFYLKLALSNLRRNRKFYAPYLLASVVTYFVLSFAVQALMMVTAGLAFRHLTKVAVAVEESVQRAPLPGGAILLSGILLILAAIGAILWAVTQYFIGKKLNLG